MELLCSQNDHFGISFSDININQLIIQTESKAIIINYVQERVIF